MKKKDLPKGFFTSAINAHIKKSKKPDLGLILSGSPCVMQGFYTKNRLVCAHIQHARKNKGKVSAVIANSGGANAFTGRAGYNDLAAIAKSASKYLGVPASEIIFASTGLIGKRLPVKKIVSKIPALVSSLKDAGEHGFEKAIMTTDTYEKTCVKKAVIGGKKVTFSAAAKGAGMIAPDMATMLVFLMTDLNISGAALKKAASGAVDLTFNRVTVDGDMSPNDTVYCLANGMAGNRKTASSGKDFNMVKKIITEIFLELAKDMAKDGEGATKFIEVRVKGAKTVQDAKKAALGVANSLLVKTAFFGEALYMGRVVSAVSSSGAAVDPEKLLIKINGMTAVRNGSVVLGKQLEKQMKKREITLNIDIKKGKSSYYIYTTDLTYDYVRINADYS